LVWADEGRDKQTVARFFAELGPERSAKLELVSSDMGEWITRTVAERCPQATLRLDPFHIAALASDALDKVRRDVWNDARRGDSAGARFLKGSRFALWKRPERLTERQKLKLSQIAKINERLYRAYLLKEQLRLVFHQPDTETALALLDGWLAWARRCRIASFVKLAKTITAHQARIAATLTHRLSNARLEAINTTLRLICRGVT
jgi:transposase